MLTTVIASECRPLLRRNSAQKPLAQRNAFGLRARSTVPGDFLIQF